MLHYPQRLHYRYHFLDFGFAPVSPPLQVMVYGVQPPLIFNAMEPSDPPKHFTLVLVPVKVIVVVAFPTVNAAVEVQPCASVTVTLYTPPHQGL